MQLRQGLPVPQASAIRSSVSRARAHNSATSSKTGASDSVTNSRRRASDSSTSSRRAMPVIADAGSLQKVDVRRRKTNNIGKQVPFVYKKSDKPAANSESTRFQMKPIRVILKPLKNEIENKAVVSINGDSIHCTSCNFIVKNEGDLKLHSCGGIRTVSCQKFNCYFCNEQFSTKNLLLDHVIIHSKEKSNAHVVHKNASVSDNIKVVSTTPDNKLCCKRCNYQTVSKARLSVHVARTHSPGSKASTVAKKLKCLKCEFSTYNKVLLSKHKSKCDRRVLKGKKFNQHVVMDKKLGQHVVNDKKLVQKLGKNKKIGQHVVKNNKCERLSVKVTKCVQHAVKNKTCKQRSEKVTKCTAKSSLDTNNSNANLCCTQCDRKFLFKNCLKDHLASHGSFNKCSSCDFRSIVKYSVTRHEIKSVKGDKLFECKYCRYSCCNKVLLAKHLLETNLSMKLSETFDVLDGSTGLADDVSQSSLCIDSPVQIVIPGDKSTCNVGDTHQSDQATDNDEEPKLAVENFSECSLGSFDLNSSTGVDYLNASDSFADNSIHTSHSVNNHLSQNVIAQTESTRDAAVADFPIHEDNPSQSTHLIDNFIKPEIGMCYSVDSIQMDDDSNMPNIAYPNSESAVGINDQLGSISADNNAISTHGEDTTAKFTAGVHDLTQPVKDIHDHTVSVNERLEPAESTETDNDLVDPAEADNLADPAEDDNLADHTEPAHNLADPAQPANNLADPPEPANSLADPPELANSLADPPEPANNMLDPVVNQQHDSSEQVEQ